MSERAGLARCYELVNCTGELGAGRTCENVTLTSDSLTACTGYRLPTDAEHEYATRAGTTTAFYGGEGLTHPDALNCHEEPALLAIGWYCRNFDGTTHPVEQKTANAFGLYDMVGNVAEYVNDPWTGGSEVGPLTDPAPFDGRASLSTVRGGQGQSSQRACRSAAHLDFSRSARGPGVGFRVVRTLPR
jgi:formylglycine-generating enzyme required for sulfatase activity